jgi:pSer/pThr/pTyr-binding forkhead associated (FHA) protein
MRFTLCGIGPKIGGLTLYLRPGHYVVGRSDDCQVRLSEKWVSRRHCEFNVVTDDVTVRDLGSRYGTMLNGNWITDEQPLRAGNILLIAGTMFRADVIEGDCNLDSKWVTVPTEQERRSVKIPSLAKGGWPSRRHRAPSDSLEWPTRIYIFTQESGFEYPLDELLRGHGEITIDEQKGASPTTDLILYTGEDVDTWVTRLVEFLQDWGIRAGTLMSVTSYPVTGGFKHERIEIPARMTSIS